MAVLTTEDFKRNVADLCLDGTDLEVDFLDTIDDRDAKIAKALEALKHGYEHLRHMPDVLRTYSASRFCRVLDNVIELLKED